MPLIDQINNQYGTIGLWELKESVDDLMPACQLNTADTERLKTFNVEKRKLEFLASRLLLQNLWPECPVISYNNSGKPLLKNSNINISITHSASVVGIFLSEQNIGIDIEQTNRNIDKVVSRFTNPTEREFIEKSTDPQFLKILLWSAKEAIFKCCGIEGVQFNEQINIVPFDYTAQKRFSGSLYHSEKVFNYDLFFTIIKNNVLVYCVQQ